MEDLGSTNGISVAGDKTGRCRLRNGKKFALSTQEFEFLDRLPADLDKTLKKKSWTSGVHFAR